MNQGNSPVKKRITCIVCPLSCMGDVEVSNGVVTGIEGFNCPRGQEYARTEAVHPKRMLTTTVRVSGGHLPLLPVVSATAIPKEKVVECARYLACILATAPVREGDVICENILGLGVDIVASRDMEAGAF